MFRKRQRTGALQDAAANSAMRSPAKSLLDLQQRACFGDSGGGPSEFARGNARERHDVTPSKRGTRRGELLGHGAIELLGVKCAVFAHRVAKQEIEERPGRVAEFAVAMDDAADPAL